MLKLDYCSLDELRPGKDASIDVRLDGGDQDMERLMASIATNGLLQPLIVTEPDDDGIRTIIGGNRRFAAMTRLRKEGRLPDDFEVPISVSLENDPGRLLEISLSENIDRLPLHPVDRYRAFARIADSGAAPEQIAQRFGITTIMVRRAMALGQIHPEILEDWRLGEANISDSVVMALTLTDDQERQLAAYRACKERRNLSSYSIRSEILGRNIDAGFALRYVGPATYAAAGGRLVENLFDENPFVLDPDLLDGLVEQAEDQRRRELEVSEGWGRVVARDEAPWSYADDIDRSEAPYDREGSGYHQWLRKAVPMEERGRYAIVYEVSRRGEEFDGPYPKEEVDRIIKAREERAKKGDDDHSAMDMAQGGEEAPPAPTERDEEPPEGDPLLRIPTALAVDLGHALTEATAYAVRQDTNTAMLLAIAALSSVYATPLHLRAEGLGSDAFKIHRSFEDALEAAKSVPHFTLPDQLAALIAGSLNLTSYDGVSESGRVVADEAGREVYNKLARDFQLKDYLGRIKKDQLIEVLRDAAHEAPPNAAYGWTGNGGNIEALIKNNRLASKPKGQLVEIVFNLIGMTGWLPPQLRTKAYTGPRRDTSQQAAE